MAATKKSDAPITGEVTPWAGAQLAMDNAREDRGEGSKYVTGEQKKAMVREGTHFYLMAAQVVDHPDFGDRCDFYIARSANEPKDDHRILSFQHSPSREDLVEYVDKQGIVGPVVLTQVRTKKGQSFYTLSAPEATTDEEIPF